MSNQPIKRMNIGEFRELGYLQEVNRLFFHPHGLALEVVIDSETKEERLGGIWDYRDDPEGIIFDSDMISVEKRERVIEEMKKHSQPRAERFGWIIQPAPDEEE